MRPEQPSEQQISREKAFFFLLSNDSIPLNSLRTPPWLTHPPENILRPELLIKGAMSGALCGACTITEGG